MCHTVWKRVKGTLEFIITAEADTEHKGFSISEGQEWKGSVRETALIYVKRPIENSLVAVGFFLSF